MLKLPSSSVAPPRSVPSTVMLAPDSAFPDASLMLPDSVYALADETNASIINAEKIALLIKYTPWDEW